MANNLWPLNLPPEPSEEIPLDSAAQQSYLESMRLREAAHLAKAREAFAVPTDVPLLGSFQEDDPDVHKSFEIPQDPDEPE